jgi:hypothetical protein
VSKTPARYTMTQTDGPAWRWTFEAAGGETYLTEADALTAAVALIAAERNRLQEWRDSVSAAIKNIPEFHTGEWGGDKEGWGFHFEVVNWFIRDRATLEARVRALEAVVGKLAVCRTVDLWIACRLCEGSRRLTDAEADANMLIDGYPHESGCLLATAPPPATGAEGQGD